MAFASNVPLSLFVSIIASLTSLASIGCATADVGTRDGDESAGALASAMTSPTLYDAMKGKLTPGAPPVSGAEKFATYRFWANEGETFHLRVDGAPKFDVYRVLDFGNYDRTVNLVEHATEAWPVASGTETADVVITHSGYHFVAIGAPDAPAPVSYSASMTVDRRHETKGIKSIAMANHRACAVLASGAVKCWGHDESFDDVDTAPGSTLASMGNALPALALPAKATEVAMANHGVLTYGAALLENGDVYQWEEAKAPTKVTLPAKALHIAGECALLANDSAACWGHGLSTVSWPGKHPIAFDARGYACVVFDDGSQACTLDDFKPRPDSLAPGEKVIGYGVGAFDRCVVAASGLHCIELQTNYAQDVLIPLPGEVRQLFFAEWATEAWLVTTDGGLYELTGGIDGAPYRWKPSVDLGGKVQRIFVQQMAMNQSRCALLEDGRVKCWGAANAGQLGLGDRVDRIVDASTLDAFGDNLPALDLGD